MPQIILGCDLARGWLDVHALPAGTTARVENSAAALARWAGAIPTDALVVFEATSGCDGPLIEILAARGLRFARVNPRQAREFARALGVLAKTDKVDALRGLNISITTTAKNDEEAKALLAALETPVETPHWGHAGSLEKIRSDLDETLRFATDAAQ